MKTKTCNDCEITKPLSSFYKRSDNNNPDAVISRCKDCSSTKHKDRMQDEDYREKMTKNSQKWQKENPLQARFSMARSNALNKSRRGVKSFEISFDEIVNLWEKGCHYCSISIINNKGVGLDRIDNGLGYTLSNVLPCCGDCNKIRNTILTVKEMEVAMKAILEYRSTGVF